MLADRMRLPLPAVVRSFRRIGVECAFVAAAGQAQGNGITGVTGSLTALHFFWGGGGEMDNPCPVAPTHRRGNA